MDKELTSHFKVIYFFHSTFIEKRILHFQETEHEGRPGSSKNMHFGRSKVKKVVTPNLLALIYSLQYEYEEGSMRPNETYPLLNSSTMKGFPANPTLVRFKSSTSDSTRLKIFGIFFHFDLLTYNLPTLSQQTT